MTKGDRDLDICICGHMRYEHNQGRHYELKYNGCLGEILGEVNCYCYCNKFSLYRRQDKKPDQTITPLKDIGDE